MEPTVYTPPQQPKDSSVNLDNRAAPMILEGQKGGEDDMDLGSYGKKNGNQNEELEEQNQELQPFEKPMNIDSPIHDAIIVAEAIPNKQEGVDRHSNENDHDNGNQSEGSGGANDDNKRGGRGRRRGSGRGRYHLSLQDDRGGRGGNHNQEVEGGNINISYNNTTTLVVHQNDNVAQSKSDN